MKDKAKILKRIWGISGRLGWSSRTLHDKLIEWEFGISLSVLSIAQLEAVRCKIETYYSSVKHQLDDQGKYMYSLMKQAGWDYKRVNGLLISKYKGKKHYTFADNWRNLSQTQKRGVINIFKAIIRAGK